MLATSRAAQIAGRCSVFAKSDMIHAQQKGLLARGDPPRAVRRGGPQLPQRRSPRGAASSPTWRFVGGVAANAGVVRALEQAFELGAGHPGRARRASQSFGAIGAALLAHDAAADAGDDRAGRPRRRCTARTRQVPTSAPLSMANVLLLRDRMKAVPPGEIRTPIDAYLGIDIGSVSTNLVVIDTERRVLKEIYLRTDARPIEAVATGLREIEQDARGAAIRIRGVGTTGSGRELIGELVGADTINDEITAHKTGAAFIDDTILGLGVDTIFEIGGQDAKFISLEDGIVVDFAMNEACAAGTGSFLEERAQELGVRIEGEFAELALSSPAPVRLGERCTVFMERDVNGCLRRGAALDDLVAGLAYSVATNYINRVVRGRRIGEVIFFQGGTAYNDAVAAAFSAILGKRIIVPPFNGVMGALGSALLAREKAMRKPGPTSFRGFALDEVDYRSSSSPARAARTTCQMQRFTVEGEQTYWGDKCSERYRKAVRVEREPVIEDLVEFRRERLLAGYDPEAGTGPVVGIPLACPPTTGRPSGSRSSASSACASCCRSRRRTRRSPSGSSRSSRSRASPSRSPTGTSARCSTTASTSSSSRTTSRRPGDPQAKPSFFCPWNQTLPFVARQAPPISEHARPDHRADAVVQPRAAGRRRRAARVARRRPASGGGAREVERAMDAGFDALDAFRHELQAAGRRALATLERDRRSTACCCSGGPYNIYDKGANLEIATKLRKYYGANVIGLDFLDLDETPGGNVPEDMFWSYGAKILAAAAFARDDPHLHIIYITNFKCGPDSYVKHYVAEASGRPFLSLQFDGHNNDAGMLTRCEAYLDSKGVLRLMAT